MTLWHRHDFELRGARPYRDVTWSKVGCIRTEVLFVCRSCGKIKVRNIEGEWAADQLREASP